MKFILNYCEKLHALPSITTCPGNTHLFVEVVFIVFVFAGGRLNHGQVVAGARQVLGRRGALVRRQRLVQRLSRGASALHKGDILIILTKRT